MASHKGWDYLFPVTSVATSGGSFNLAKGQLGLIDLEGVPTASQGLKVINSLNGLSKNRQLQLRVGKHDIANNRSQSSKDWSSETFRVSDIIGLKVDAPKEGIITDKMTLGYNGIDADSAIVLEQGENEEISITLCGEPIGMIGYADAEVEVKLYMDQPNTGDLKTMQQIVEEQVEIFNNYKLMGDIPITNYVKAKAINSENSPLAGTTQVFYTLTIEDLGDSNALAAVQSQYNTKVVRTDRVGDESVYTIIGDAPTSVAAGALVTGTEYVITSVGTTDFTTAGASANTVGTVFVATGTALGNGTVDTVEVTAYLKNKAWKVKGCADCPTGYSELAGAFVYAITIPGIGSEDDLSTITDNLVNLQLSFPNIIDGTEQLVGVENGEGIFVVAASQEATQEELDTFATNSLPPLPTGYSIEFQGEVEAICSSDNVTSTAWVQSPESCVTSTETYTLILEDDECGDDKLAQLQAAYPELEIAIDSQGGCKTKYTTDVVSNLVCDECDDIIRDLFVTEAPSDFENKPWIKDEKVYSETALMGIQFEAQPIEFYGSEVYRDDMPFIATAVKLKIAGGASTDVNESFFQGTAGRFALTVDRIGAEPENWGGNLRELEDITKRRQEGVSRHEGNNYAKWILGEETMLKAGMPYVDYILTIRKVSYAQSFSGEKVETFNYHFAVEPGVHADVESLLNTLAGAAGVESVQAYRTTAP